MTKIDHDQALLLAKAQSVVQKKKTLEATDENIIAAKQLKHFISELDRLLSSGISIEGLTEISDITRAVETYGQATSELLSAITSQTGTLTQLTIPKEIKLKQIIDPDLLDALKKVGDNGELLNKIQQLDKTIGVLREVIIQNKVPKQGQTPSDYIPVRVVEDVNGKLGWLAQIQTPSFVGVGGNSGGLTDAELRASPVPVLATIDTTGLATEVKQDATITAIENIVSTPIKPTDAYSIQAISETATHKYFFFEDSSLNWYVMRKTLATSVFDYTKGTGGYSSVYVDSSSAPSGSPTFASYGATF